MLQPSITIYTQPTCQGCHRLKAYLKQKGIEYHERNVLEDEAAVAELQQLGALTTPVIVVETEVIVGFDQAKLERLFFQETHLQSL